VPFSANLTQIDYNQIVAAYNDINSHFYVKLTDYNRLDTLFVILSNYDQYWAKKHELVNYSRMISIGFKTQF
jgi:hypothetical protein